MKLMVRTRRGWYVTECDRYSGDAEAFWTSQGEVPTSEWDASELIGIEVVPTAVVEQRVEEVAPALTSGAVPTVADMTVADIMSPSDTATVLSADEASAGADRGSWSLGRTVGAALASLALVIGAGVVGITVGDEPPATQAIPCATHYQYRGAGGSLEARLVTVCPLPRSSNTVTTYGPWKRVPGKI